MCSNKGVIFMFDIGIAFILMIFAIIIGKNDRSKWSRSEYIIYYVLWLTVAFFGTYGLVTELFY